MVREHVKSDGRESLTVELAHSNKPPMGANMMPMPKRIGSTVLGVRMGLMSKVSREGTGETIRRVAYCHAFKRC